MHCYVVFRATQLSFYSNFLQLQYVFSGFSFITSVSRFETFLFLFWYIFTCNTKLNFWNIKKSNFSRSLYIWLRQYWTQRLLYISKKLWCYVYAVRDTSKTKWTRELPNVSADVSSKGSGRLLEVWWIYAIQQVFFKFKTKIL